MKYSITFQEWNPEACRPYDEALHDDAIKLENGEFYPLPAVGDSITCDSSGKAMRVRTRHFAYTAKACAVTIVVEPISPEEFNTRVRD